MRKIDMINVGYIIKKMFASKSLIRMGSLIASTSRSLITTNISTKVVPVIRPTVRYSSKSIKDVLAVNNPETNQRVFQKLKVIGQNYKKFLSVAVPIGSTLGVAFVGAHLLDIKNEENRKITNKELVGYPIVGIILGGFIGATSPVWICFSPIYYIAGGETTAALIKVILAAILLSDEKKD
uniref:Uncharacterized protein n=1 Tax=viral metagenome TaxID=1070528 RepID=A0A6C0E807_9ZZZZ